MSKNIAIQEGGIARQFTADKLKTALVGGGNCYWVPEDEVNLSTLSVTENGTYDATDDGSYGYSQVRVNVPGGAGGAPGGIGSSIKGVDPDTGNESLVTVDENGNIEKTDLPSSIRVETPPDIVEYIDGVALDYTGLVVKAYKKNGQLWTDADHPDGIIPINELTLSETTADIDKVTISKGTKTLDGKSVEVAQNVTIIQNVNGHLNCAITNTALEGSVITVNYTGRYMAVMDNDTASIHYVNSQDGEWRYRESERGQQGFIAIDTLIGTSRVSGKQLYYEYIKGSNLSDGGVWSRENVPDLSRTDGLDGIDIADIALYGTGTIGGGESILVAWTRPGDATELTDSFVITVIERVIPPN